MTTRPLPVSVVYPRQPTSAVAVAQYARVVLASGGQRLWLGQSLCAESHQVLAYLAGMGVRLPVGVGVSLVPLRHPYDAAVQARSLALLTGQPVVAGYGAATPEFVAALRGSPFQRPAAATAGYLTAVRGLLSGTPVRHECEACTVHARLPELPHPPVELGLGVLRPGLARLAGAVADVAITWLTPPDYLRDVLAPALARGAGPGRPPRIAAYLHAAITGPDRDPYRLVLRGTGAHLASEVYTDMLRRAGICADPADPVRGARALVDSGLFAYGTAAEIAACVHRYLAAGVSEVAVSVAGVAVSEGDRAAVADLTEILAAIADSYPVAGSPVPDR